MQLQQRFGRDERFANDELRTIGAEHPDGETTAGFVGKPHENALAVPILLPIADAQGLACKRMPRVINRDLLKTVCTM